VCRVSLRSQIAINSHIYKSETAHTSSHTHTAPAATAGVQRTLHELLLRPAIRKRRRQGRACRPWTRGRAPRYLAFVARRQLINDE
jgi:hypothetical protein